MTKSQKKTSKLLYADEYILNSLTHAVAIQLRLNKAEISELLDCSEALLRLPAQEQNNEPRETIIDQTRALKH